MWTFNFNVSEVRKIVIQDVTLADEILSFCFLSWYKHNSHSTEEILSSILE